MFVTTTQHPQDTPRATNGQRPGATDRPRPAKSREPGLGTFAALHVLCCGGLFFVAAGGASAIASIGAGVWAGLAVLAVAAIALWRSRSNRQDCACPDDHTAPSEPIGSSTRTDRA